MKMLPACLLFLAFSVFSPFWTGAHAQSGSGEQPESVNAEPVIWSESQAQQLRALIADMPAHGMEQCGTVASRSFETAEDATRAALQLARAHMDGCTGKARRGSWNIATRDHLIDAAALLRMALERDELGLLFDAFKPQNPHYQALHHALQAEEDPEKRRIIALNMERWRWMPLYLGERYLVVNAASYEVTLWEAHRKIATWPVIVGKVKTPTPVFDAEVSGAIFNPWWEIPASIAAEGIASMVRNRPAAARRRGYVYQNGRYRQRPGPGNALGQMKLIMPNRYSVFLHDTSNRKLFAEKVRMFSHGCVRVGDAIGFAKTLLAADRTGEQIDQILDSRRTTAVRMSFPIPLYVAYFTAESDGEGGVVFHPDIYGRDGARLALAGPDASMCGA